MCAMHSVCDSGPLRVKFPGGSPIVPIASRLRMFCGTPAFSAFILAFSFLFKQMRIFAFRGVLFAVSSDTSELTYLLPWTSDSNLEQHLVLLHFSVCWRWPFSTLPTPRPFGSARPPAALPACAPFRFTSTARPQTHELARAICQCPWIAIPK